MREEATAVTGLERTVGPEMTAKIQSCKILMVGSGGIGCELLKSLAMSGFRHVEVIDLDTIDVSNLNRQLLFRGNHVGQPKCTVACQVAAKMVPPSDHPLTPVKYIAHHGNICDTSKFNVPFISQFDLVLNALDNVEARRRANRLCLAAKVPLIEAGTTGYLGQVTVIHKPSQVACYECKTQETQKVYPICTIRSTPSMPVHTIVWAKELYKLIFHSKVEESMLYEDRAGEEPSTYMDAIADLRTAIEVNNDDPNDIKEKGKIVIEKLYQTEITKQLDMGRYKTAKKTPSPLSKEVIDHGLEIKQAGVTSTTAIWQPEHCVTEFLQCLLEASTADRATILEEFDKDDALAMRLVTAASNLRSFVFGIEPLQSLYSAKGIAGNIIPAIAT
jgi:ubiquitin-like 1-activating enzyme E1 B